jgi:hypothetical protein
MKLFLDDAELARTRKSLRAAAKSIEETERRLVDRTVGKTVDAIENARTLLGEISTDLNGIER